MTIIIFGATGGVGMHVTKTFLEQDMKVTAYVRTPSKLDIEHENLTIIQGDAFDKEAVKSAISGHDSVISCIGSNTGMKKSTELGDMTKNIVEGMIANNVKRIVYTASAGIENEIPGIMGKIMSKLLGNVLADHRNAVDMIKSNDLNYTIVRPMSLNNKPITGVYKEALSGLPSTSRSISRADVAHFICKALANKEYENTSVGISN